MTEKEKTSILYKEKQPKEDYADLKSTINDNLDFGTSALYGRTERNVTFLQRGAYDETKFDNAFPHAYFNFLRTFFRLATMFFRSK